MPGRSPIPSPLESAYERGYTWYTTACCHHGPGIGRSLCAALRADALLGPSIEEVQLLARDCEGQLVPDLDALVDGELCLQGLVLPRHVNELLVAEVLDHVDAGGELDPAPVPAPEVDVLRPDADDPVVAPDAVEHG